ncbi:4Fe-4S dicluster domain-containing protein [Geomonas ferrireducens]|uniref:4Fe-4S dicluster domain-containing protein n=1 Tax=Geomonas ferrireducens TaxID=2570227 RepID=UPI0010A88713|nr:4Fe-4S dicluster domain-containing protein [Geomonas ferrireducens]
MAKGMFVDTTICTGCKACQVACKQWNGLSAEPAHFGKRPGVPYPVADNFTGDSYDNTGTLSATDWRHVRFIEQIDESRREKRWLFSSDSCKHCSDAGCLNACPTKAIVRTDLGNVVVQQETCIGCKFCIPSCPYGVISFSEETGTAHKCTLCNDRIHNGLGTACAKACPTGSIRFGELADLKKRADARLAQLKGKGEQARIYGYEEADGLNVFYLFADRPKVYGQPEDPVVPQRRLVLCSLVTILTALGVGAAALVSFRERLNGRDEEENHES